MNENPNSSGEKNLIMYGKRKKKARGIKRKEAKEGEKRKTFQALYNPKLPH